MTSPTRDSTLLISVLDCLIPPIDDLAGAGGLDLESELHRMSNEHTKYEGVMPKAIDEISNSLSSGEPDNNELTEAISQLEKSSPQLFTLLLELVYLAYYSDPRVHERIGWKTGALQPDGFPMEPWDESVLDTVRKREPFWTKVD
jgi:hypothetical protein